MSQYMRFIPENIAIKGARRIGIYNAQGNRVGQIPLGNLAMPSPSITGNLLYKVGLMSDVHINYQTAQSDLRVALAYLHNEENVLFSLIAGDLTGNGTAAQFSTVKSELSGYDVEFCIGNHDVEGGLVSSIEQHTGKPLYYTRSVGDDLYIFFGMCVEAEGSLFTTAMLNWLESSTQGTRAGSPKEAITTLNPVRSNGTAPSAPRITSKSWTVNGWSGMRSRSSIPRISILRGS